MFHRVTQLAFPGGYRLRIEMEDGAFGELDLTAELSHAPYEQLRDMDEFLAARLDHKGVIVWPSGVALDPAGLFLRLKLQQFFIGAEFVMSGSTWRCTDVGMRTVSAIKLDEDEDPRSYNGPPYGVVEHVLDEYDLMVCQLTPLYERLARERLDAMGHTHQEQLLRLRDEIREPVWIKRCSEGVARIGRGDLVLDRAALREIARHDARAVELLDAKKVSTRLFGTADSLLNDYGARVGLSNPTFS